MISNLKLESDDLKDLIKARLEFDKAIQNNPIGKDAKGNRGAYLSLEGLQEATIAIMEPLGLTIKQTTDCENGKEYLITTLRHKSGQFERSVGYLFKEEDSMDGELAKLCGAIMTYKQRYQWRSILGIGRGSEDVEDMDTSRQPRQYAPPAKPTPKPLDPNAKLTLQHQKEILTVLKSNPGAIAELCVACDVDKLGDIYDVTYDKVLAEAKSIAQDMGI